MARMVGFRIRNFGVLRDVSLGSLMNTGTGELTSLTAVTGRNGSGKRTLIEAFGFLADCLKFGAEDACDARGGFHRLRSQGVTDPVMFEIHYRENPKDRPITYEAAFDLDGGGRPFVKSERLRQRRRNEKHGRPYSFLILENGKGVAWKGPNEGILEDSDFDLHSLFQNPEGETNEHIQVELDDCRKPGIAVLGALKQHPRISALRKFIEGWHLSRFTPDAARSLPHAGPQRHLNVHGDNLGNVIRYSGRAEGYSEEIHG